MLRIYLKILVPKLAALRAVRGLVVAPQRACVETERRLACHLVGQLEAKHFHLHRNGNRPAVRFNFYGSIVLARFGVLRNIDANPDRLVHAGLDAQAGLQRRQCVRPQAQNSRAVRFDFNIMVIDAQQINIATADGRAIRSNQVGSDDFHVGHIHFRTDDELRRLRLALRRADGQCRAGLFRQTTANRNLPAGGCPPDRTARIRNAQQFAVIRIVEIRHEKVAADLKGRIAAERHRHPPVARAFHVIRNLQRLLFVGPDDLFAGRVLLSVAVRTGDRHDRLQRHILRGRVLDGDLHDILPAGQAVADFQHTDIQRLVFRKNLNVARIAGDLRRRSAHRRKIAVGIDLEGARIRILRADLLLRFRLHADVDFIGRIHGGRNFRLQRPHFLLRADHDPFLSVAAGFHRQLAADIVIDSSLQTA